MIVANTMRELFEAARVFCVPNYQRAYAWEAEYEITTFWEDIWSQHPEKPFYFGTFLLQEGKRERDLLKVYIVDGQQRLTTMIIFLSALIRKIKECSDFVDSDGRIQRVCHIYLTEQFGKAAKLRTIKIDSPFFEDHVRNDNPLATNSFETPSQRRLWEAKVFFEGQLKHVSIEQCFRLLDIVDNSKVLVHSVDNPGEATQIFEFQNDRGKDLTDLESIKSFLMHHIYLCADDDENQILESIQTRFENIYRKCEELNEIDSRLGEDNILNYHCIAMEGATKPAKGFIKTIVRALAVSGDRTNVVKWIKKFTSELEESFEIALKLLEKRDTIEEFADLYILDRMAHCYPLIIKTFRCDPFGEKFRRLLRVIEIFIFRGYGIAGFKTQIGDYLNPLAADFSGDFDQLLESIKSMMTRWNLNQRFLAGLRSTYFYGHKRFAKYMLWKYENSLRNRTGNHYPKISWRDFLSSDSTERLTIEHIAAQKGDEVSYALATVDGDSEEFREKYLHCLGNLVLDSHSSNASKNNKPFPEKSSKYGTAPLVSQNILLGDFVVSYNVEKEPIWDVNAILKRQDNLVEFALRTWDATRV